MSICALSEKIPGFVWPEKKIFMELGLEFRMELKNKG